MEVGFMTYVLAYIELFIRVESPVRGNARGEMSGYRSGGVFWALLRPTSEIFAIPPWAPEVAVPSDQWNGKFSLSHLPVLQLARLTHSRWLAPPFGMGFHWHCDGSLGFTLTHSTQ